MGRATLDGAAGESTDELHEAAAQLCRDYATVEPAVLRDRGHRLFAQAHARGEESVEAERRELMVVCGWTSLLTACVENDLNLADEAERSRRTAAWLGREAGHTEIVAWAYELGAWFALTTRRWRDAIELAAAGQQVAPGTSAAVQLAGQEARAWARLGERRRSEAALGRCEAALDLLPLQRETDHLFVVDDSRTDSFRLDCHRWLGDDRLTEHYAAEVLARWDVPTVAPERRKPMRVAGARVSLGVVAARAGDLDAASDEVGAALAESRRCLPWLGLLAGELIEGVLSRWPDDPRSAHLVEQVRASAPEALAVHAR
ncbi:hypothetical protein [Pseudofrankia inefficax]|uniref:Uncharacterized protein n=1 Tax=Pseudofrankia inefficax (strain DSM 45817 / CECT 9037 / DDB 130130 / EuI1c) TaxID=298654 RepID=E3J0N0_PSEI1|nr:hypothetical protein [Pseudofrankia inefficax]ADP82799.1 hypothetical protein FraEuI1c_4809 [Pseudofrankia inefficax]